MEDGSKKITVNISTAALVKIVLTALLIVALYIIREVIFMLIVAMILASAMDPLVDWLYRKVKFPRGVSVLMVYLVFLSLLGLAVYFVVPVMVAEFSQLSSRIGDVKDELATKADVLSRTLHDLGIGSSLSSLGQGFKNFTDNFFQTTIGVVGGLAQFVGILVFSFYLISSENGMKNFIKSLAPYKHQPYVASLTEKIQKKIGYWLLGQLILSGFIFNLTFIGLSVLGVKYALALALFAGLLEIVPYIGPIVSAVPAILVALVQSPPLALFVLGLYILIQQTENYILVPKIMGKTIGANPLVILVAVLIGFKLAGIVGMLMAVPIVGAATVFLHDLRESRDQS